jgi:type IX secretion system PorP/SprF family membrane protein
MKKTCTSYRPNVLLFILMSMTRTIVFGQDIHFSQFFETPLLRNPSLAGIFTGDYRVQAVYRDQWNSVTNAYKTVSLNGEYKRHIGKSDDFVSVGLQLLYDRAGTVSWVSTHLLPALNFHKSLGEEKNRYLSLGFMGGPVQRRIDISKMTTNSQYDGLGLGENLPSAQYIYLDGSVGISYNAQLNENQDNNMFAGLAYHHFTRPKNSFYRNQNIDLAPKWVASGGVRFSVTPESYLTLQADYSTQNKFKEAVLGALYAIKLNQEVEKPIYTIHGGAFFRWNDAFIPAIKIDYRPFSFSFSYDINISRLKPSSYGRGGFEAGISFIGFTNRDNSALNYIRCPRF